MRLFLEFFGQTLHQRLKIFIETPGDFISIHPQFYARYNIRLLQITDRKTIGDLLFQGFLNLCLPRSVNAKSALNGHTISAAADRFTELNAFFLIERFDSSEKFIYNPLL